MFVEISVRSQKQPPMGSDLRPSTQAAAHGRASRTQSFRRPQPRLQQRIHESRHHRSNFQLIEELNLFLSHFCCRSWHLGADSTFHSLRVPVFCSALANDVCFASTKRKAPTFRGGDNHAAVWSAKALGTELYSVRVVCELHNPRSQFPTSLPIHIFGIVQDKIEMVNEADSRTSTTHQSSFQSRAKGCCHHVFCVRTIVTSDSPNGSLFWLQDFPPLPIRPAIGHC